MWTWVQANFMNLSLLYPLPPSLPPSQSPAVSGAPVAPSSGIQSPAAVHVAGGPGVGGMLEEDEHGISICLFVYTIF